MSGYSPGWPIVIVSRHALFFPLQAFVVAAQHLAKADDHHAMRSASEDMRLDLVTLAIDTRRVRALSLRGALRTNP